MVLEEESFPTVYWGHLSGRLDPAGTLPIEPWWDLTEKARPAKT